LRHAGGALRESELGDEEDVEGMPALEDEEHQTRRVEFQYRGSLNEHTRVLEDPEVEKDRNATNVAHMRAVREYEVGDEVEGMPASEDEEHQIRRVEFQYRGSLHEHTLEWSRPRFLCAEWTALQDKL